MMRSLFSGVAGLKSHQTRMDVVGNNISNINTVGFKSSRVTFADMLSQTQTGASTPSGTLGGTNPKQIGLGTAVASIDLIFTDGSPQATGKNTDVALSGNGLFVLKSGNQYYYTRDGAFEFDANGNYVLPGSGYYVQGWNAIDGSLNTNTPPTDILVPAGKTMSATATSSVNFTGNLNAGAPVITSITFTEGGGTSDKVINGGDITEVYYEMTDSTVIKVTSEGAKKFDSLQDAKDSKDNSVDTTNGEKRPTVPDIKDDSVKQVTVRHHYTFKDAKDGNEPNDLFNGETYMTKGLSDDDDPRLKNENDGVPNEYRYTTDTVVTKSTYDGTLEIGEDFVESINVDGTNIISGVLHLSDGTTQRVTTGYYQLGHSIPVTTSVTIYDSEGKTHAVTMLLDKKNATTEELEEKGKRPTTDKDDEKNWDNEIARLNNRWMSYIAPGVGEKDPAVTYTITEDDGSKTVGFLNRITASEYDAMDAEEKKEYSNYAIYTTDTAVADPNAKPIYYGKPGYIYFNNDGTMESSQGASLLLQYSQGNGADDTTSSMDFSGLTQFNGSTTAYPTANGNAFGVLQSIAIDGAGIITGTYTNGVRRFEAQIAVAQFINSAGLTKIGTSLYQESNNSGSANIKTVTNLGLTITPSALEMSNVDLANELSDMIVTQRGFQSNSKIITVADEMLETIVNMKR